MNPQIFTAAAVLTLLALALVLVPMLRYRKEKGVGLSLIALVILLPLCVLTLYGFVSTYPWDNQELAEVSRTADSKQPPVSELITKLAERLEREPSVDGYVLLGRSYMQLQRYSDAVDAWHKAWELSEGKSPEVSLGYAEAQVFADRRSLQTSAADLLEEVILVMPDDPRALWYGGMSAAARDLDDLAVQRISKLLEKEIPDDLRMAAQQQLVLLGAEPPAAPVAPVASGGGAGDSFAVNATISIAPELAERIPAGATLFLFARDASRPGPPVAVKRMSASGFPISTQLTDANAMIQGSSIANVEQLKLVARVSVSGNAIAGPGDMYGEVLPAATNEKELAVNIVIDNLVE
jgi:cytochrome c-type biogenesis protein CcmH